jgi:hypothetical protein
MTTLITNLWQRSPLSATFARPSSSRSQMSPEPLLDEYDKRDEHTTDDQISQRCELRVEGMTCVSCGSVRLFLNLLVQT